MVAQMPRRKSPTASPVRWDRRRARAGFGPQALFAAAAVAGLALWVASRALLSPDAVVPVVATLFLALAAVVGVIAYRGRMNPDNVTYTDVAGALTLIGLCAAATIDPEQMVRLVAGGRD
jgi:hypothetical protein